MSKKLFISKLMHERDKFELLLNRVGYTRRMTLQGVAGKWSIKDVLAVILAHEQFIADRMYEVVHDVKQEPSRTPLALDTFCDEFGYPDFESPLLNDMNPQEWVIEKYKNVSLDDVVAQDLQAFEAVIASLESLSESSIQQNKLYERVANHTYKLYREHIREIKHWLAINAANSRNP